MCWRAFCSLRISCEQSSADSHCGVLEFAREKKVPTEPAHSPPIARYIARYIAHYENIRFCEKSSKKRKSPLTRFFFPWLPNP